MKDVKDMKDMKDMKAMNSMKRPRAFFMPFMPFITFMSFMTFVFGLVASAGVQTPPSLDAVFHELDTELTAGFAKDPFGGASIGVVVGSKVVWTKHYGFAEVDAKRVATNDTAYRIGSITKQFTALMLLQLVEQGKVRLTDPLEKYVPEVRAVQAAPAGTPPITLLQVATMHAGLAREPDGQMSEHSTGPVSDWPRKVLEFLPRTKYVNEPGTTYLYSNIGYATLGLALERIAGRSYTSVVTEQILRPLGMTRTVFEPTPAIRADLAHGYSRSTAQSPASRAAPDRELDGRGYRVPNGALFSTITDLTKFVAWELGEGPAGILKKETQAANYSRVFFYNATLTAGYGVGFQAFRRGDLVTLGHGGSTAGYHASALFHGVSKVGVVVLCNSDFGSFDAGPVAQRVLERVVPVVTQPR